MSSLVDFDGGYARNSLEILFQAYLFEHDDPKERQDLERYLESNYPDEFKKFKESIERNKWYFLNPLTNFKGG